MNLRFQGDLGLVIQLNVEVRPVLISHQHVELIVLEPHPLDLLSKAPLAPTLLNLLAAPISRGPQILVDVQIFLVCWRDRHCHINGFTHIPMRDQPFDVFRQIVGDVQAAA